jgi:hypothetical protein
VSAGRRGADALIVTLNLMVGMRQGQNRSLIVIDPRFTRSAAVADLYCPIRQGTDIAFLGGVINYLLQKDQIQHEYVSAYTNASFIVKEGFGLEEGLFTGYDADKRDYDKTSWEYEIGADGLSSICRSWTRLASGAASWRSLRRTSPVLTVGRKPRPRSASFSPEPGLKAARSCRCRS